MNLTITPTTMVGATTEHTAAVVDAGHAAWRVSWLADQVMDHSKAVTAMLLADTVAEVRASKSVVDLSHWVWPLLRAWAAKLDVTVLAALTLTLAPPAS